MNDFLVKSFEPDHVDANSWETLIYLAVISDANNGLNILYQKTVYHQLVLEVP